MSRFRIVIAGEEYLTFTNVSLNLKYDSVASLFSIDTNFNSLAEGQRALLMPLMYQEVRIYVDEITDLNWLFTGVILRTDINSEANPTGIKLSGYSKTGILTDCQIPRSVYPLEDIGKSVKNITRKIIAPLGVELHVNEVSRVDADRVIAKTNSEDTQTAADYIVKVAAQFNIIVGHTKRGRLLFTKAGIFERPRGEYSEGAQNYINASLSVDGRAMHSVYTIVRQKGIEDAPGSDNTAEVRNNLVPVFRQKVMNQSVGAGNNTGGTARSARMKGLSQGVQIKLELDSLLYQDGSIIRPNRFITLQAPSIYISDKITIFVKDVTLNQTPSGVGATLNCVLKEALTGGPATNIFS